MSPRLLVASFVACVLAGVPVDAQTTIPAASASWIVDGNQLGAQLGQVQPAGDVDGDGYDDILIGAALFDGAFVDSGRIFLYRGGPGGPGTAPAWTLDGDHPQAFLGLALGVGDIDADGFDDVAVLNNGSIQIFRGSGAGLPPAPSQVLADTGILSGGDVDGDGFDDLAVGGGPSVRVYRGSSAGLATVPSWNIRPSGSVTGVVLDDLTGDGLADLGYTTYEERGSKRYGKLFVHRAGAGGLAPGATRDIDLSLQPGTIPIVRPAGDIYGDGDGSLAVGLLNSFTNEPGASLPEAALLFRGTQAGVARTATVVADRIPPGTITGLGEGGDLDGDGFGEFLVAEAHDQVFGSPYPPFHRLLIFRGGDKGPSAAPTTVIEAESQADGFPGAVAAAGDVDGDGIVDIMVGAPLFSGDEDHEGRAYLFLGGSAFH